MKKSKNLAMLITGIVILALGILIPSIAFNQSKYYEVEEDFSGFNMKYNFTIYSKKELNINAIKVQMDYNNKQDGYETVLNWETSINGKIYEYSFFVMIEDYSIFDEIESVEIETPSGVQEINEKINQFFKVPIMIFTSSIGVFLILAWVINKNHTGKLVSLGDALDNTKLFTEDVKNNTKQENETKSCEYCGSIMESDATVCSACGAKFTKK